jgi:hypothetical protein
VFARRVRDAPDDKRRYKILGGGVLRDETEHRARASDAMRCERPAMPIALSKNRF